MGFINPAEFFVILSVVVILFIPSFAVAHGNKSELVATTIKDFCGVCGDCTNSYKDGTDNCCNHDYTYPDDDGTGTTPTTNGQKRPTPRCCPAYFGGYCCDKYAGICNRDQRGPSLLEVIGNFLFNAPVATLLGTECYCDNRCSPPQIVCKVSESGANYEIVPYVYCKECWDLYCYCKEDSRIKGESNPCKVLYEEYTSAYDLPSTRIPQPDCCYEEYPKLSCPACGKTEKDIKADCPYILPLLLQ